MPRIVRFNGRNSRLAPLDSRSFALDALRHQPQRPCRFGAMFPPMAAPDPADRPVVSCLCHPLSWPFPPPRQAHIKGRTRALRLMYALNVASIYQPPPAQPREEIRGWETPQSTGQERPDQNSHRILPAGHETARDLSSASRLAPLFVPIPILRPNREPFPLWSNPPAHRNGLCEL